MKKEIQLECRLHERKGSKWGEEREGGFTIWWRKGEYPGVSDFALRDFRMPKYEIPSIPEGEDGDYSQSMKPHPFLRRLRVRKAATPILNITVLAVFASLSLFAVPSPAAPGDISTVAGNGVRGYGGDDGAAIEATLNSPMGVALDAEDNLYIADLGNHCIRRVDAISGAITTIAGTGVEGFNGDNIAATSAQLDSPFAIEIDKSGNLYIADTGNSRVRRVDAVTGIISTIAGTGTAGFSGDGGPATAAKMREPIDLAFDSIGNLYLADYRDRRVRKVDGLTGAISTVAGTGSQGYNGDGIPAVTASLHTPWGIAVDRAGHLFISDAINERIRRVDAVTGLIATHAGNGETGFSGDGGVATAAQIDYPAGMGFDGAGNLFIAVMDNHRVRRVDAATGEITTVAGTEANGYSGDGGPATSAQLKFPNDVVLDSKGHLYIADQSNNRIRRVESVGKFARPLLNVSRPKPFPMTRRGRSSRPQVITIRNEGSGGLEGLAVSLSGRQRRDFRVTSPAVRSVPAEGETNFMLSFKPRGSGIRKAGMTVRSGNGGAVTWPVRGKGK
jgi:sugar lactone lactonase YvrE